MQPTFSVIGHFQYQENYAIGEDGNICGDYWKNKGGESITLMDGITLEMVPNKEDLLRIARNLVAQHEWDNPASRQFCVGVEVMLRQIWTFQDQMNAYDWGEMLDTDALNMGIVEEDDIILPDEKYIRMAEELTNYM